MSSLFYAIMYALPEFSTVSKSKKSENNNKKNEISMKETTKKSWNQRKRDRSVTAPTSDNPDWGLKVVLQRLYVPPRRGATS